MNIFYLIIIIVSISFQNVFKKQYNSKTSGGGVYIFNVLSAISALAFFAVSSDMNNFNAAVLPYSTAFAFFYSVALVTVTTAIGCGSLSVTSLIFSFSLLIPTLYGLFFLNEPAGAGFFPGLVLLIISLVLVNKKEDKTKISFKWIINVFFAFVGNGMCSVVQKMQQIAFDGRYKGEFMSAALIMVGMVLSIFAVVIDKRSIKTYIKNGWYLGILSGVMNGAVNFYVMVLAMRMSASLMFPLISAGGIIVTYIVSKTIFKEYLTKFQFFGFLLGIGSIILFNI